MTRKFTFLIMALLALMAIPGWGQTTYTMQSYSNNVITSDNNATWATTSACGGSELPYTLNSKRGAGFQANNTVTSSISVTNASKITVIASSNGNKTTTLAVKVGNTTFGNTVSVPQQNYQTLEFTAPNNTTASGTIEFTITRSAKTLWIGQVIVETASSTDPTITVNPTSIDLGTVNINEEAEATFTVSQANLTNGITLSAENGNLDTESIVAGAGDTEVTYTITPNAAGEFSDVITISCTDLENDIEINVSGNAYDPSQVDTFEKFTGNLEEGDYVIYYNGYAMKNTVSNNRLQNLSVTPANNAITNPDAAIVWHIAQSGDYWTIYNDNIEKYAAGTTAKNQAALIDAITDYAKWTVTASNETYEFVNLGRSNATSDPGNKYLRNNGSNGWACYALATGGALTLYKKVNSSSVATPTFTPAAGTYTEAQNVTIACTTEGAAIYYTLDGSTPTNASTLYTSAIAVNETTTIKAIAYLNDEASSVASATYTINIIVPLTSMDAIFAKANEVGGTATDVTVTFGNWVVSGVKGSNAYLTDGTKGLIIYASGHGFEVGDILSGTAACKVQLYRGAAELTTLTSSTDGLTVTEGGSVTAQEFNINDLSGINTGAIITVNNVTYSGSNNIFTDDDENEIKAYNTFMTLPSFTSDRQYNITGVYIQYDETKEIAPRTDDDIYLIPGTEYAINLLQNEHGTIFADFATASAGQTVTLSATPIEHYHLTSWTVLDDDANEIPVSDNQFIMPASDVEVEATFAEDENVVFTYYYNGEYYTDGIDYVGTDITLEEDPDMSPVGFSFVGWSTSVASTDVIEGTTYTLNSDVDFYAVFAKQETSKNNGNYTIVTDASTLQAGDNIVIVANGYDLAMAGQNSNNRAAAAITRNADGSISWADALVCEFQLMEGNKEKTWAFFDEAENGYIYAASSSSNNLKTQTTLSDNSSWKISITDSVASVIAQGSNTRNVMQYNSSNNLFSCYASANQKNVQLYKKQNGPAPVITGLYTRVYDDDYAFEGTDLTVEGPSIVVNGYTLNVTGEMVNTTAANLVIEDGAQLIHKSENVAATVQMNINGYGNSAGGYYLVATPIAADVDPDNVANMLDGEYDLYRFDESEELEWRNYKAESFNMNSMNGYLYANHDNTVLSMAGILNSTSEILTSTYSYTEESEYAGHNIVGNPFACNAELDRPFYTLNEDGSEFLATEGTELKPCQGALVVVESADDEVYFDQATSTRGKSISNITIEVSSDNVLFDRAIISNSGRTLEKFMLDPSNTKLYIPQNGNEYAVVSADAKVCEMPVNFKAAQNGTYTLSFNLRNMDLDYLHMIDNMTGEEIDVLATPSYTFSATQSDFAARFRLMFGFNAVEENCENGFAFMSNGNLIINNIEGEATMQIVDVAGRVISTETVNGSYNKALNLKAGVYVIKLNEMTQKVVVK